MFTLPLINYQAVKHKIVRLINSKSHCNDVQWINKIPLINARTVCTICHEKPVLPHHINCSHVFCFYCISVSNKIIHVFLFYSVYYDLILQSIRMVDEKFECPECCHFENNVLPVILN